MAVVMAALLNYIVLAAAKPVVTHDNAPYLQKFDFGGFDELTSGLDPTKLQKQVQQALKGGTGDLKTSNAMVKMMQHVKEFSKEQSEWKHQALDAFRGKLSNSCDKVVKGAEEASISVQDRIKDLKIQPDDVDGGCVHQLSGAIKTELQSKLPKEKGLGSAVAYVSVRGASYGCASEASMASLDLAYYAAMLCGEAQMPPEPEPPAAKEKDMHSTGSSKEFVSKAALGYRQDFEIKTAFLQAIPNHFWLLAVGMLVAMSLATAVFVLKVRQQDHPHHRMLCRATRNGMAVQREDFDLEE